MQGNPGAINIVCQAWGDRRKIRIRSKTFMGQGAAVAIMESVKHPRLDDAILNYANIWPEKVAIRYQDRKISYADLSLRVEVLSFYLHVNSINPGKFVAVLLDPAEDIIIAMLSIFRLGAIYVPLDPGHPDARIKEQLKAVSPAIVLTQSRHQARLEKLGVDTVCIDEIKAVDIPSTVRSDFSSAEPACVFFTSGSTGKQKAVLANYESLSASIIEPSNALGITANDTIDSIARYAWSISMLELLGALVHGGTTLILDRERALDMNWLPQQAKLCTAFHCPPALLKHLAEHIDRTMDPEEFTNVQLVWYGGDTLTKETIRLLHKVFPSARIATAYGTTEILGLSHCYFYDRCSEPEKVMIGRPVGSMTQLLLNGGKDESKAGSVGEIYLGGPRVAMGYFTSPDLTAEKFIDFKGGRYFATGDFARLDKNGDLEYLQRKDSQVKVRGNRVDIGEVEHQLRAHSSVKDGVVIAKKDTNGQWSLHGFVVFRKKIDEDLGVIRNHLSNFFPEYMVPVSFTKLDALPYTENFKIDRASLAQLSSLSNSDENKSFSPNEVEMAKFWEKVGCFKPGFAQDNFFDVGGNSIAAVTLVTMLNEELGIHVDVADIYRNPTLSDHAFLLEGSGNRVPDREKKNVNLIVELGGQSNENLASVFIIAGLGDHVGSYQVFADSISGSWNTYGVLHPSFKGLDCSTIEAIAEVSAANITAFKPQGPYYIVGYSMGGLVAIEIAKLLKSRFNDVRVVLLDTKPTKIPPLKSLLARLPIYARGYAKRYFSKEFISNWRARSIPVPAKSERPSASDSFSIAYQSGEKAVNSYVTSKYPVSTMLVRSEEIPWWDDLRAWGEDYGWSDIVDLNGVIRCPGTHLSIVKAKEHWKTTGLAIGDALRKLSSNNQENKISESENSLTPMYRSELSEMVG